MRAVKNNLPTPYEEGEESQSSLDARSWDHPSHPFSIQEMEAD
jgi:hypothetical protein